MGKIVLVDAKGNTLGEVERTRDNDKSEEISKKTSQKKKKQSKKKQSKQKQSKQKQLKQEQSKQNDYVERHNNITAKRRITKKC